MLSAKTIFLTATQSEAITEQLEANNLNFKQKGISMLYSSYYNPASWRWHNWLVLDLQAGIIKFDYSGNIKSLSDTLDQGIKQHCATQKDKKEYFSIEQCFDDLVSIDQNETRYFQDRATLICSKTHQCKIKI